MGRRVPSRLWAGCRLLSGQPWEGWMVPPCPCLFNPGGTCTPDPHPAAGCMGWGARASPPPTAGLISGSGCGRSRPPSSPGNSVCVPPSGLWHRLVYLTKVSERLLKAEFSGTCTHQGGHRGALVSVSQPESTPAARSPAPRKGGLVLARRPLPSTGARSPPATAGTQPHVPALLACMRARGSGGPASPPLPSLPILCSQGLCLKPSFHAGVPQPRSVPVCWQHQG